MSYYRLSGQDLYFSYPIAELKPLEISERANDIAVPSIHSTFIENELISRSESWISGKERNVEVYDSSLGIVLKVEGCGEFYISQHGETIGKLNSREELSQLDREIILGPVLVLALALRGVWSLHASAAMYKKNVIVILGESGQGKSTLAAYLSQSPGWRLVVDDILPVKMNTDGVTILPHFPQLKLPMDAQPGVDLPEQLPLKHICVLTHAEQDQMPELHKLSTAQTVQALLGHTAGTRMFDPALLTKHLEFSTQAAKQIIAYKLIHPHRRDTLPLVREFLESIC